MSAAQDYYNQVLGMGHSPENALAYTRQHYPDFVPGVAQAVAPPVMAPVSQQPVPAAQPVAQPAVAAAPAQAAPVAAAPAVAAPAGCTGRLCAHGRHPAARRRHDPDDVGCCGVHRVRLAPLDGRAVQSFVDRRQRK